MIFELMKRASFCEEAAGYTNRFKCSSALNIGCKEVLIERCISEEILELNRLGIRTRLSCCGHLKGVPWVIAGAEHKGDLLALGYDFISYNETFKEVKFKLKSTPNALMV